VAHGLTPLAGPIDAHVHCWDLVRTPQPWIDASMAVIDRDFGVDALAVHLAAIGAGSGVLVQADHSVAETEWMLDLAAESTAVAGVVGWVDLDGDPAADLDRIAAHPASDRFVGVRHLAHIDPDPAWLSRPGVVAGVRALGAAGLAFDLVVRDHQLAAAAALAEAAPGTTLVLDHLGNPRLGSSSSETSSFDSWASDLCALAQHERVVAKLSGLVLEAAGAADPTARLREAVGVALDAFGPSRLMAGSDWPLVLLHPDGATGWASALDDLLDALSPAEREAIARGTAIAAYGGSA